MRTTGVDFPPSDFVFWLAGDVLGRSEETRSQVLESLRDEESRSFAFNRTELVLDFEAGTATIHDVLRANASVELPIATALAPIEFAQESPERLLAAIQTVFGPMWKEATVWLSCINHSQDPERIALAAILLARATVEGLPAAVDLGRLDFRDLLVATNLADQEWPTAVNRFTANPGDFLNRELKLGRNTIDAEAPKVYRYSDLERSNQLNLFALEASRLADAYSHSEPSRSDRMHSLSSAALRLATAEPDHGAIKALLKDLPARPPWLDPRNPGWNRPREHWMEEARRARSALDNVALELRAIGSYDPPDL